MASRQELLVVLLLGPLVDLANELATGGVLADPPQHVGLDQLRAPLETLQAQVSGSSLDRHGRPKRGLGVGERNQFELVELGRDLAGEAPRKTRCVSRLSCAAGSSA